MTRMTRNANGSWYCDDCRSIVILFDDDTHTCTPSTIYVVWGPTAAWADGSGPLFYTDSFKDAASYVRAERKLTIDHAAEIVSDDIWAAESYNVESAVALNATEGYGRAAYDAATQIVGWPSNQTPYWVVCEDRDTLLQATGYDGDVSDDDAVFEYLNAN